MGFFTNNVGWKLLSLAAAFFIWVNIASEPELATILSAPVEYKNYPKDLEISSTIVDTVNVEARGPSGLVNYFSRFQVPVGVATVPETAPETPAREVRIVSVLARKVDDIVREIHRHLI